MPDYITRQECERHRNEMRDRIDQKVSQGCAAGDDSIAELKKDVQADVKDLRDKIDRQQWYFFITIVGILVSIALSVVTKV